MDIHRHRQSMGNIRKLTDPLSLTLSLDRREICPSKMQLITNSTNRSKIINDQLVSGKILTFYVTLFGKRKRSICCHYWSAHISPDNCTKWFPLFPFPAATSFGRELLPFLGGVVASLVLHKSLLRSILHAPITFFDTTPAGRILSRFSKDLDVVDSALPDLLSLVLYCAMEVNHFKHISLNAPLHQHTWTHTQSSRNKYTDISTMPLWKKMVGLLSSISVVDDSILSESSARAVNITVGWRACDFAFVSSDVLTWLD